MYSGYGFRTFEIGDVDVVKHDGVYHLFHLTLPNHDYIAHAVSDDGLRWRRVKNALFISDPRAWDDDMLWTMHVSPDPYNAGAWRMFYTGLSMEERGRIQRIGMARSDDLYTWRKDTSAAYPLEISDGHYEHSLDEGRQWVSFRDPFYYREDEQGYLLAAARAKRGPIIRRGCVALVQETAENQFEFCSPLFFPHRYDDVEVPGLVKMADRYYLIGSTREDVKVHYWYADHLEGPYYNFSDNVLLPQGNYAARVSQEGDSFLVWNFFFKGLTVEGEHLMAPPKELVVDENGELRLKSFSGFQALVRESRPLPELVPLTPLFDNPHASGETETTSCWFASRSGLEVFTLQGEYRDFILTGELVLEGSGKCGLAFRLNEQGDGYYLSLDVFKGIAQLRAWGHQIDGVMEEAFHYEQLQAAHYVPEEGPHPFCLIAYEQYLEFSLHGSVLLTLADDQFRCGRVGFYVESVKLRVDNAQLKVCAGPPSESYPQDVPNF
jgi:beta-fructofuranosidase